MKVHVDRQGSINPTFLFTCYGVSSKSIQLDLVRWKVNRPMADVCQGGQIRVAFYQYPHFFEVDNNKVKEWHPKWSILFGLAFPYEILNTFFDANQLSPIFLDSNGIGHKVPITRLEALLF